MAKLKNIELFSRIAGIEDPNFLPCKISEYVKEVKSLKDSLQSFDIKTSKTKNGYLFLTRSQNKDLFLVLDQLNVWDFFISKEKDVTLYLHQLVLFLKEGYRYFVRGYGIEIGLCETHHKNHNTKDNSEDNLVYCSPALNKVCSQATSKGNYFGFVDVPMAESMLDAANLVQETVEKTFKSWGLIAPAISITKWLMNLPAKLKEEVIKHWKTIPEVLEECGQL